MSRTVFIDPGKHSAAMVLSTGGTLLEAYYGPPELCTWSPAPRIVAEKPTVYRKSPVPPEDLVDVAIGLGYTLRGLTDPALGVEIELVLPRVWKGTTRKSVKTARLKALAIKNGHYDILLASGATGSKMHNVLDAYGLWQWDLKRKK